MRNVYDGTWARYCVDVGVSLHRFFCMDRSLYKYIYIFIGDIGHKIYMENIGNVNRYME